MYLKASIIFLLLPLLNGKLTDVQVEQEFRSGYETYIEEMITTGSTKLALEMVKDLLHFGKDKSNIILAPMSVTVALALILLGSRGTTFNEVSHVMGLNNSVEIQVDPHVVHEWFHKILQKLTETKGKDSDQQLSLASAIFVQNQYPIRGLYKAAAANMYRSEVLNVDFIYNPNEATQVVNAWIAERTEGKVNRLLDKPPTRATKIIIASVLYFKAPWEYPFMNGMTKRRPFYTNGRNTIANVEVEMMSNGGIFPYYKDERLGCEILGLPYKSNGTTMYIIVPSDSSSEKLKKFQSSLKQEDVDRLADSTKPTGVSLAFPKMKMEGTTDLSGVLNSLGLRSLFSPSEANLALLSPVGGNNFRNPGLYADQVIQKVYMDITESGTEAAAAESVALPRGGSRVVFKVDVPFLFFITHKSTKTILLWGTVIEPKPCFPK